MIYDPERKIGAGAGRGGEGGGGGVRVRITVAPRWDFDGESRLVGMREGVLTKSEVGDWVLTDGDPTEPHGGG